MWRKLPFHVIQAAQRRWLGAQCHLCLSTNSATTRTGNSLRIPLSIQTASSRAKNYHATSGILSPLNGNPVIITPTLNEENGDVELVVKDWLEADSFQKLIGNYRKYNKYLGFDSSRKKWRIPSEKLEKFCSSGAPKLRNELIQDNFVLGKFAGYEGKENASVTIVQENKGFLIFCPPQGWPGDEAHDVIRNQLDGVTELIKADSRVQKRHQLNNDEAYLTYDIWLVAQFLDLMEEKHPEMSMVLCDGTKESVQSRFDNKKARQRPVPELEGIMTPGSHLHPHQNEGIRFLQDNNGCGIISFEMGLGKTLTSLAYIAAEKKRAVVVCPKNVRSHWENDALEFLSEYFRGRIVLLGSDWKANNKETRRQLAHSRLVCINYESLEKFLPFIIDASFDCLVLDESHMVKNPKAQRTQRILDCKDSFESRILLSGTPLKNNVGELSTQLEIAGSMVDDIEKMNPGALWNMLLKRNIYLKKTMKEELPHLQFKAPKLVDVPLGQDDIVYFDTWHEEDLSSQVQEKLLQVALEKTGKTSKWALDVLRKDQSGQVIVFTERKASAYQIFDSLDEAEPGAVLLHHGGMSDRDRGQVLSEFRSSESSSRVLVSTRQSLAVGVNLQCANTVIFNDMPWSPADIQQAVGRVRRLNQKKQVNEYWMKSNTLFDTSLMTILHQKIQLIIQYAEGKNLKEEQLQWMNERVSIYDIVGIKKPTKKSKKRSM